MTANVLFLSISAKDDRNCYSTGSTVMTPQWVNTNVKKLWLLTHFRCGLKCDPQNDGLETQVDWSCKASHMITQKYDKWSTMCSKILPWEIQSLSNNINSARTHTPYSRIRLGMIINRDSVFTTIKQGIRQSHADKLCVYTKRKW